MVDIVIPAFNAHNTINRCLASIASQTIISDINVIIVNDCSDKDYSESIHTFENLMNVKEIKLEKNSGPGTARRIGMQNCNSEYIMFIDADDTFGSAYSVSELLNAIINTDADCINSTFYEELETGEHYKHDNDMVWVFGKIYKRSFLDGYHIEFNDTRANEDNGFNTLVCLLSDNVKTLEGPVTYNWHWNSNSITRNNDYAFNGMEGFINNQIWAYEQAKKYPTVFKKRYNIIQERFVKVFIQLYVYYLEFAVNNKNLSKYLYWCKKYYDSVFCYFESEITAEYFNECYISVISNNDNIMKTVVPVITIYQFISALKDYDVDGYAEDNEYSEINI